jgi:phospholipase/lecithinase/hemolysin
MKKFILCFLTLLLSCQVHAAKVSDIVFFGDSLSDNGNLYRVLKVVPKSPPYYYGRFTNGPAGEEEAYGPIWAEQVAKYLKETYQINAANYAVGGATAVNHGTAESSVLPIAITLDTQLLSFYAHNFLADKSQNLYVIWIGANDYLYQDHPNVDALTTEVVDKIISSIDSLANQEGHYFMVLNLPDPAKTPFAIINGNADILHELTTLHNQKLANAVAKYNVQGSAVHIVYVDTNSIFKDMVSDISKYNEKYKVNITNLNQACWSGGFLYQHPLSQEKMLNAKFSMSKSVVSPSPLSKVIVKSPGLLAAYTVGQMKEDGLSACTHPDEYLFWDDVHPSAIVHHIISVIAINTLNTEVKAWFTDTV